MIALFDRQRARLLAILLAVAVAQLSASIAVAGYLHHLRSSAALGPIAALALGAFALEVLQRNLSERIGLAYTAALRDRLFRGLLSADPQLVHAKRHGAMLQSFVGDLTALRQWVSEGIMRVALAVLALGGLFGWIAYSAPGLAPALGAITAATLLVGAALIPSLLQWVRMVRRERGRVAALASDRLAASATVLACGRTGSEAARLGRRVARLNRAWLRRAWLSGTLRALPHLAVTAMLIAAVYANPRHSSGSIAGLVLVIGMIGHALRDLARAAELAVPGRVARQRIERLLAIAPLNPPQASPQAVLAEEGALVFDALYLADYAAPLTARLVQGARVLVEGDPAQRASLFRILGGTAHPASGEARWSGQALSRLSPARRRKLVGWASTELPLIQGSDRLNLRYRAPWVSDAEVDNLLVSWGKAGDRPVGARLNLLRALLGTPPVLLVDAVDHSLDLADRRQLAATISNWPGVVLMATGNDPLRDTATHRLLLHRDRAEIAPISAAAPVRLVATNGDAS